MLKQSVVGLVVLAACGTPKPAPAPLAPVAAIAPRPSVALGYLSASAKEDELRHDLESRLADLQRCHEARSPEASGAVTIWFRIAPDGAVAEASASGEEGAAPCFADVLRATKFALDGAGVAAQVTFKLEPVAARPALAPNTVGHK